MEMKKSEAVKVTLEDFEAMSKDERFSYELIDGVVMMSPSPSFDHQKVGSNCTYHLRSKIEAADDRQCDVLYELDIKVNGDVYRPDVLVFCGDDREIPLVVIEVISPTSNRRDMLLKPLKYEQAGIAEYWIVDPDSRVIIIHDYKHDQCKVYTIMDMIQSAALGISIAAAEIFEGI